MSSKKTLRVTQMKSSFMGLHSAGVPIEEIAERFGITPRTIYIHLQEIADENGVSRDSLLKTPHRKPNATTKNNGGQKKFIDTESLIHTYDEAISTTENLVKELNNILES